mmetsp:Transcript_10016/g.11397  ORF Transcript_10016/g.11397 Transcript_10016/m.11397 type:complete len:320 (+) Transcript_10016:231-1190(+)
MFYYDHTLAEDVPSWTYLGFGIGLFAYQTLDAIDGKQARRTGSSSPLGQLFDHGCDTLSTTLVALALIHTLKLGLSWQSKLLTASLWLPFYLAQLLEYHVGLVRTHVGNMGVTEGQLGQVAIMIVAALTGDSIFSSTIVSYAPFLVGIIPNFITVCDILITFVIISSLLFAGFLFFEMISNKKTLGGKLYALWGTNPIFMVIFNLYMLDPKDDFTSRNASAMIMAIGIIFTLVSTKVIISSMAMMHINSFQIEPLLFSGYFYFHYFYKGPKADEYAHYALVLAAVISFILYLKFVRVCIIQITQHLGIYCFSIKKPKQN